VVSEWYQEAQRDQAWICSTETMQDRGNQLPISNLAASAEA
jgi:hypothetical protein